MLTPSRAVQWLTTKSQMRLLDFHVGTESCAACLRRRGGEARQQWREGGSRVSTGHGMGYDVRHKHLRNANIIKPTVDSRWSSPGQIQ